MRTFNPSLLLSGSFILTFLLAACGSEQEPVLRDASPWQESAAFQFEMKYLPNALLADGQLHVLTRYSLANMESADRALHKSHDAAEGLWLPVPLTRQFFPAINRTDQLMDFYLTLNRGNSQGAGPDAQLSFGDLGADIAGVWPQLWTGAMAANAGGQLMVPFERRDGSLVLILFDVRMTAAAAIDTVMISRITLPDLEWIQSVNTIGNDFFVGYRSVSGEGQTARIGIDGAVEIVLDEMFRRKMFPFNGKWYAMGNLSLYQSENEGKSWQEVTENYPINELEVPNLLQAVEINGETILYGMIDSIFRLEKNGEDSFTVHRVDLEGLSGNLLTSLHEWNGRVYATTLSGLYYREVEDFLVQARE